MVHKPKHKVHSFRGLLGDGGQDEIRLERQNANVAYRIVKFQTIGPDANTTFENVLKIFKDKQSSVDAVINFSDPTLLAATTPEGSTASGTTGNPPIVIFDNVLFSRNIFITNSGTAALNYYIEIEEVPVSASALIQIKLGTARRNIGGKIGPTPA